MQNGNSHIKGKKMFYAERAIALVRLWQMKLIAMASWSVQLWKSIEMMVKWIQSFGKKLNFSRILKSSTTFWASQYVAHDPSHYLCGHFGKKNLSTCQKSEKLAPSTSISNWSFHIWMLGIGRPFASCRTPSAPPAVHLRPLDFHFDSSSALLTALFSQQIDTHTHTQPLNQLQKWTHFSASVQDPQSNIPKWFSIFRFFFLIFSYPFVFHRYW